MLCKYIFLALGGVEFVWSWGSDMHPSHAEKSPPWRTDPASITTAEPQHHIQQTQAPLMEEETDDVQTKRGGQHGKANEHKQRKPVTHNMESKGIWQWKGKKEKQTLWQNKSWLAVSERVSVCFGASLLERECVGEGEPVRGSGAWGPTAAIRATNTAIRHEAERACSWRGNPRSLSAMTIHTVTWWSDSLLLHVDYGSCS